MDYERTLTQKIILWALLAMAVIFTVVNIILKLLPGVAFEDTLLKASQDGDRMLYTGEKNAYPISIAVYPDGTDRMVELTIGDTVDHTYRVSYPGGTIETKFGTYERLTITLVRDGYVVKTIFDGGYNPDIRVLSFCALDGEMESPVYIEMQGSDSPWHNFELTRGQVMNFANGPETTTRGSWLHYGMAIFCSVICAVAAAFPYTLFELKHHWSVKDPEPTEFYLRMNELSCGVVAVVILIVYIIGVTKIV